MLTKNSMELLFVLNKKEVCTLDYLVGKLNLSKKAVLNALDELDEFFKKEKDTAIHLIRKSGDGIRLVDKNQELNSVLIRFSESSNFVDNANAESRYAQILLILINADSFISLQDIADEMFVSKGTVVNDMDMIDTILNTYNIKLERIRNRGLRLNGNESDIRKLFSSVINGEVKKAPINVFVNDNLASLYDLFDKEFVDRIRNLILDMMNNNSELSNIQVSALLVHVIIAIKRMQNNETLQMPKENAKKIMQTEYYKMAEEFTCDIEKLIDIKFALDEICYIALHLMCSKKVLKNYDLVYDDYSIIDEKLKEVVNNVIQVIADETGLDSYQDKELMDGLILHLKPTIERLQNNLSVKNPYLKEIKKNYVRAFDIAIKVNDVLNAEYQIKYNEDEIAYIALHVQAHIERCKENHIKNIAVVCITGVGSSQLLLSKLRNSFKNGFNFVTSGFLEIQKPEVYQQFDLILSTVPLKLDKKVIIIDPILTDNQLVKIAKLLQTCEISNEINQTSQNIFTNDHIYIKASLNDKEEVIAFICDELYKKGEVSNKFKESVLERENIAGTAYGMIAIPHGNVEYVNEPSISILVCKQGIGWKENTVKIVFLIALNKTVHSRMGEIFDNLYALTSNSVKLSKMINAENEMDILSIVQGD